jgi:hypothetical protein
MIFSSFEWLVHASNITSNLQWFAERHWAQKSIFLVRMPFSLTGVLPQQGFLLSLGSPDDDTVFTFSEI